MLIEREGCTVDRCEALTRLSDSTRVLGNMRERTFDEQVNKYTAIWNAPHPTEVVVAAVNLALPGANGPVTAVPPPRDPVAAEPASQSAAKTPVATPASVAPSPQEPPPLRDPAAAEPVLQSAAETPVATPASVAPLPPHRPPQVRAAIPRAFTPQP